MQKLLCYIGFHKYKTLEMTDCFTSSYTDRPTWSPIKHMVWYQQCACCGKRRVKDTVNKDMMFSTRHNGVEFARIGWVEYGKAYIGNGKETTLPPTAPKPTKTKTKLKVVNGGKNE